jgi:hypothetical protein
MAISLTDVFENALLSLKKIINNVFLTAVHAVCGMKDVMNQDREARQR